MAAMRKRPGPAAEFLLFAAVATPAGDMLTRIAWKVGRHAVAWLFYLCKPEDDWLLSELGYSDVLSSAF